MKKALSILLAALILLPATCLPVFADDAPAFSTYDEMVAYVRQALTARDANIRFRFDGSGFQPPAISDLCADSADGKAGDYLRLSFDGGFPQTTKDADGVYTVAARFFTDAAQEAQVDAFVRGAADACEAQTPREKARYIYDLLCSEVAFDLENLYDEAVTSKYTAWGAAVEGKAVCQGFAQLYYRLAKALELPCRIVTGTRAGENHAWNIVEVDGYWYHVDAASGAQLVDPSSYFLRTGFDGYRIIYGDLTAREIGSLPFASGENDSVQTGALTYTISWTLDQTAGTLIIDGTGAIPDYRSNEQIPFHSVWNDSTVIGEGITRVGDYAFRGSWNLKNITLPSTLVSIGKGAFEDCYSLTSITIPGGVTSVGELVFSGCDKLMSIRAESENTVYHDEGDCLIKTADKALIAGCANSVIPADGSVTKIANFAFDDNDGLTAVSIPGTVREIGVMAFSDCTSLENVTFGDGLEKIQDGAFMGCESLQSVALPRTVSRIAREAFGNCSALSSITVDADNPTYHASGNCLIHTADGEMIAGCANSLIPSDGSVAKIGLGAFEGCTGLTQINVPAGVTEIQGFLRCTDLQSVTLPNTLVTLGGFSACSALRNIEIPDSVRTIDGFNGAGLETVVFGAGVETIGLSSFSHCNRLRQAVFKGDDTVFQTRSGVFVGEPFTGCDHLTIYGHTDSTAEAYAHENSIPFETLCPVTDAPHAAVTVDAFDATCLEPAYTAGTRCADCGEWLSGHEPVGEPLGHTGADPVRENVTDPTCTAEGAYDAVIYCARCGEKLSSTRERIAAVPHADRDENGFCDDCGADICEHSRTRERVGEAPATCTANGYSGDTVCLICGRTLLYGATIPAAGHAPVMTVTAVSPTCISAGRTAGYACSVCGEITTASRVLPVSGHTDEDADGWCDVCFSPEDCTRYGVCGDAMYWFVANETLTLSGAGDSYAFSGNAPWDAYRDDFDCVYLRAGVRTVDGTAFGAANRVFAPVGASVTDCPVPALVYTDDHGTVSLTQTDGVCAMQVYDVLNAAYVLCMDREVRALRFDEIALESTEDDFTYDILMNGKLVDERHFTVPAGTVVRDFTVKTAGYASFNDAMAALGSHPDRNLILSVRCDDLLLASMKTDPDSYTVQIVVRFVDEPDAPVPDEEPEQKGFLGSFIDRFKATLAAILALFRKLFKLFTGK